MFMGNCTKREVSVKGRGIGRQIPRNIHWSKCAIDLLQQTITWYKIRHVGGQKKATDSETKRLWPFKLDVSLFWISQCAGIISFHSSMAYFVPCDRLLQKVYLYSTGGDSKTQYIKQNERRALKKTSSTSRNIKVSLVVLLALHFVWFIYTLQWRLIRASLEKEIRQEEVLTHFPSVVWSSAIRSLCTEYMLW